MYLNKDHKFTLIQQHLGLDKMLQKAGVAGTITHPSSAALPNVHVLFRWNTVDVRTKNVKVDSHHAAFRLSKKACPV